MKRNYFLFVLLFLSSFSVFAQSGDEKAVRQILNDVAKMNKTGNYAQLDQIYASDFVFINAQGKKFNKAERIANLKSIPHPDAFSFENVRVRIFGNSAVVNSEVHIKPNGQSAQVMQSTIIFVKEAGHWVEVNSQATLKG